MMKNVTRLVMVGLCSVVASANAADDLTLIPQTVEINGYSIPYTVYVPNVANTKGLPILLFLHGRTEQVTERQALTHSGIGLNLQNHPDHFPAVIVMPQATPDGFWDSVKTIDQKNPNSPTLEQLAMKALDETMTAYESDPTRVYLTGNSMGGYGSWKLGSDFPDRFAAIMPISGGGHPDAMAQALKNMPIYAFHGALDFTVKPSESTDMVAAVRATGNPNVHYTEYPWTFHDAWDQAYGDEAQMKDFFSQKLPH